MCSVEFQTVPLCSCIQGFSFCSIPLSPVAFHRIAAFFAAAAASERSAEGATSEQGAALVTSVTIALRSLL